MHQSCTEETWEEESIIYSLLPTWPTVAVESDLVNWLSSFDCNMFKNLKEKLATQVNKTNQTLFSAILPTDTVCFRKPWRSIVMLIVFFDWSKERNRSRADSASSDVSQTSTSQATYVSPARTHAPPSDIESDYGGDESDHETTAVSRFRRIWSS